jgi:hypothetical protein
MKSAPFFNPIRRSSNGPTQRPVKALWFALNAADARSYTHVTFQVNSPTLFQVNSPT